MNAMASNPLLQVREILASGLALPSHERRREVVKQAAVFKAAVAHLDDVRDKADRQGRTGALRRLADMKQELVQPLRWIAEAEGLAVLPLTSGRC